MLQIGEGKQGGKGTAPNRASVTKCPLCSVVQVFLVAQTSENLPDSRQYVLYIVFQDPHSTIYFPAVTETDVSQKGGETFTDVAKRLLF